MIGDEYLGTLLVLGPSLLACYLILAPISLGRITHPTEARKGGVARLVKV